MYLKNRVSRGWTAGEDHQQHKPIAQDEKADLRNRILPILASSPSQIRAQLIPVLRDILRHDFPAEWPNFLDITMQLLSAGDASSVFAGLHFLLAICRIYLFKSSDNREDFNRIVEASFPQLLAIGGKLREESSPEAWEMLRIVLKTYKHAIYVSGPSCALEAAVKLTWDSTNYLPASSIKTRWSVGARSSSTSSAKTLLPTRLTMISTNEKGITGGNPRRGRMPT